MSKINTDHTEKPNKEQTIQNLKDMLEEEFLRGIIYAISDKRNPEILRELTNSYLALRNNNIIR